jgi:hypothetical protein
MDLVTYCSLLPADRIEIYGIATPEGWHFLTVYSQGDVQCWGSYIGKSYMDAIADAGRLEKEMSLPVFDHVGYYGEQNA